MKLSCGLFEGEVDLVFRNPRPDGTASVSVLSKDRLVTPCGTLDYPPGTRLVFSKARVTETTVEPLSGTDIKRLD
jgi:hypothetical protein